MSSSHPNSHSKRPDGFPGQRLVVVPPEIAVKASRQPISRDLCVTHIGCFSADGGHHVERPHGTSQHILIACMAGKGSATLGGTDWRVQAGDLLFLPPRERHLYRANPRSPWTIFWIHFRGLRAADYLSCLNITPHHPILTVNDPAVLSEAFEDTFRHANHGFSEMSMTGMSTAFARLLGLARIHQRSTGMRARHAENRLLKALALMRDQPAQPWTLDELARTATMSVPHFTELCHRQTGMPPLALLIRLRLQRAMNLLQQGNHNVAETAAAVGYDDPFYFSRLFKKHMGISPSACRQGP